MDHSSSFKLKLFGFELELDPCKPDEINQKRSQEIDPDSPANSSSSTISSGNKEEQPHKQLKNHQTAAQQEQEDKNFVCQYCYKRFANSQALGGHQNAHKKERMKKKRLQLQERTASINYYLQQPFQNGQVCIQDSNYSDESQSHQISFSSYDHDHVNGETRWFSYGYGPIDQQNPCKFSLTHVEKSHESKSQQ